jgi:hypothetical protein
MRIRWAAAVLGLGYMTSVTLLQAHHSVGAKYDTATTITIKGVVIKTEWTNPHTRFWLDARHDDGTVSTWEIELPPPNALIRAGLEKGKFIEQGDDISVSLWRAKDGSMLAHALTITVPGGRVMSFPRGEWGPPAK